MKPLTIGQVARGAGIGIETIRFYERQGLLEPPPRRESGYRIFGEDSIRRLSFIKRAKELGFSLKEIGELLALQLDPSRNCRDVKRRTEAKLNDVQARIDSLKRMSKTLRKLVAACDGSGSTAHCPILEALEDRHRHKKNLI